MFAGAELVDRFVDGMNLQVYEYLMRAVLYHPSKKNKSLVNYNINTSWGLLQGGACITAP